MTQTALFLTIIGMGLITFFLRYAFIGLGERIQLPPLVRRGLVYVPTAVLTAIIFPDIFVQQGSITLNPLNPFLLSAVGASIAAWLSKNVFAALVVGMGILWTVQWLAG